MNEAIKKFLKNKYGKWLLGLIVLALGGSITFNMVSTSSVVDVASKIASVEDVIPDGLAEVRERLSDIILD